MMNRNRELNMQSRILWGQFADGEQNRNDLFTCCRTLVFNKQNINILVKYGSALKSAKCQFHNFTGISHVEQSIRINKRNYYR